MLSWSETFCSAVKTTIGAVPRQYNEIRVDEINHDIYSKHTFAENICNYKKNKGNGQSQQFPKIYCTSKRYFYQKAWKLQKKSSRVTPKHTKDAEIMHPCKTSMQNFAWPFFPPNSQLTLQPPGGTHYDGPYGEAPPERGIFLRCANRKPKVATCEA